MKICVSPQTQLCYNIDCSKDYKSILNLIPSCSSLIPQDKKTQDEISQVLLELLSNLQTHTSTIPNTSRSLVHFSIQDSIFVHTKTTCEVLYYNIQYLSKLGKLDIDIVFPLKDKSILT